MPSDPVNPTVADAAAPRGATLPQQRVSLRVMARRRRHVLRNGLVVLVVTAVMVVLSLANRDWQDVRRCRENLDYAVGEFRRTIDSRLLPRAFPQRPETRSAPGVHYHYQPLSVVLDMKRGTVGICCCARPHRLFLDRDGRHVVTYDGKDFAVRWVTEREFADRAATLGLTVLERH